MTIWPECSSPGCDHHIYYRSKERTVCEACRTRGGSPPPKVEPGPPRTDADRVRDYLLEMSPERRHWQVRNLEQFNQPMAEFWGAIMDELEGTRKAHHDRISAR